jgi:hypothetical protein
MTDNQSTDPTDQPTKPRRTRWRKILLYMLLTPVVLIAVPVIAGLWHHFHVQSQIEAERRQIADRGEPVTAADLAADYALPDGVVDRTDAWISVIDEITLIVDDPAYEPLPIVGSSEEEIPLPGEPWQQQALVEQLLAEAKPALERLSGLIDEPEAVRYPIDFNNGMFVELKKQIALRNVLKVLSIKARHRVYQADGPGALNCVLAIFQATETLENEPALVSQVLRILCLEIAIGDTCDLLPHAGWSERQLKQLQGELVSQDHIAAGVRLALLGERVFSEEVFSDSRTVFEELEINLSPLLGADQLFYLQYMERMIAAYKLPYAETIVELESLEAEHRSQEGFQRLRHAMSQAILPLLTGIRIETGRGTASLRCAATLVACERYHLAHGSWPAQLSDLTPQFMEKVPLDPFDGQPLRYQLTPEAVMVYSIGQDLVDDGGTFVDDENMSDPDIVLRRKLGQ